MISGNENTGLKLKKIETAFVILYLTPQRGMPSAARHDVTISWRGALSGTRLTALSDFSLHLLNTYETITFCPQQPRR
jgi:hypothetical protein